MSVAVIPASSGAITSLATRNGRFLGYNLRFSAAGRVRIWSGQTNAGSGATTGLLAEVDQTAGGSVDVNYPDNPGLGGEQYVNGIYVEYVSGAVPEGFVRFRGPHS